MVLLLRKIKLDALELPEPDELVPAEVRDSKMISPFLVNTITVKDELIGILYSRLVLSMIGVLNKIFVSLKNKISINNTR